MNDSRNAVTDWPGKRLGLPETGPRSIGRTGRRLVALAIDWAVASGLGFAFFGEDARFEVIAIFAVLNVLFICLLSGSLGHLCVGLRVVPLKPAWIGIIKPVVRTTLLCLVIPAVIWDADQRGLHDKLATTILVRR